MSLVSEIGGFRAVRFAERFTLEFHEGMWVSKPTFTVRDHRKLTVRLGLAINGYESAKDEYDAATRKTREENKEVDKMLASIEKDPRFDFYPGEREDDKKFYGFFTIRYVNAAWKKRVDAALQLRECVNNALAQGILQTSADLIRKLQECNEERLRFAYQLSEYKSKRILPIKKEDKRRERQN